MTTIDQTRVTPLEPFGAEVGIDLNDSAHAETLRDLVTGPGRYTGRHCRHLGE